MSRVVGAVLLAGVVGGLAGCDWKKEKISTQAAARVNDEEITVHQINHVLEQQRGLPPEQAASASRQVLAKLIDQELALQEARNQKLDRDPKVVRQLDAARREIIARAYVERVGASVSPPAPDEVRKYYDANPALFKERKIYTFEELTIEAKPDQIEALKAARQSAKTSAAFIDHLKAQGYKHVARQAVTPAERVPLAQLSTIAKMDDGHVTYSVFPQGLVVLTLISSREQPVAEEQARPAIEQFLLNERRQKTIESDIAALRSAAKIEYVGEFGPPASAPAASGVAATATTPADTSNAVGAQK